MFLGKTHFSSSKMGISGNSSVCVRQLQSECRLRSGRGWRSGVPSLPLSLWDTWSSQNEWLCGWGPAFQGSSSEGCLGADCPGCDSSCALSVWSRYTENIWTASWLEERSGPGWHGFTSQCKTLESIMPHHRGTQATGMWLSPCLGI